MLSIRTLLLSALLFSVGTIQAQISNNGQFRLNLQEVKALKSNSGANAPGSSNYSAVKEIVVMGDPSQQGIYTILLKIAPNTKIAAHLHPDQRAATVLSGTWYFGYGDKFDEAQLKKLPAGSIYSEVAGQNHFAMTGKEPVIVEITGLGPSGVTYVNEQDDPSHK
ncbi:cupin domain-containing protein [Chitinophaga polysaccharea]|uniref:cupin domain-containing protein n=1 Tax=Chitinophaga polysaccharea TaxID=1293035 RepID=UPI00145561D9|nr:cupin domain-containing protein [Chitinophaga polysaccharea]NLR62463.1 cupin domain-containing protein [Chitinophaga polysaccharea]